MQIKTLLQVCPTLIHALVYRGMYDNGGAAGVDRVVDIVSGRYGDLADNISFTKNADGTWTPVSPVTGAITGNMPVVVAEKIYVAISAIGGSTAPINNPVLTLGSVVGINLQTNSGLRSGSNSLYASLPVHLPASNAEISARLFAFKNTATATKEAYYKGWVKDAAALTFNDSYAAGQITSGAQATAIVGTVDSASMSIGPADTYNLFAIYILALNNMPSQASMDAAVRFMSGSRGELSSECYSWR